MESSAFLLAAMGVLACLVPAGLGAAVGWSTGRWRTGAWAFLLVVLLMALQGRMAAGGILRDWDRRPPALMVMVAGMGCVVLWFVFSRWGRQVAERVPLWALVGFQAFRLPLELTMHCAAEEGVMPVQMSYAGWNFDILTGAGAAMTAGLLYMGKAPGWLPRAWNWMGCALLGVIVGIAIASTPMFAAFGPERLNIWVTYPVFVWLPGMLVPAALAGHLLIFRKLRAG